LYQTQSIMQNVALVFIWFCFYFYMCSLFKSYIENENGGVLKKSYWFWVLVFCMILRYLNI